MKIMDLYRELQYQSRLTNVRTRWRTLGGRDRERASLKAQLIAHSQYQIKSVLMNCTNLYRLPPIWGALEKGKRKIT